MALRIRHTAVLLLGLVLVAVVTACGQDTRTPEEEPLQEYWENSYWRVVETVGKLHDSYLYDVMRDDEEKISSESGVLKDARVNLGDNFELVNTIFSYFIWELIEFKFDIFLYEYKIHPRGAMPICLFYADTYRNIVFLEESATPVEASPYAENLMDVMIKLDYEFHLIDELGYLYLEDMSREGGRRNQEMCDDLFDLAKRSVDPDSPEYNPHDPKLLTPELPKEIVEWLDGG